MFAWLLKLLIIIGLSSNGVSLEKTSSTNEVPGIWTEQPGTIPVCASMDDRREGDVCIRHEGAAWHGMEYRNRQKTTIVEREHR
jgi:hypothetical protein